MIAKIIVHGRDRQEAIARMKRTLEMTVVEGIKTTIPLHLKILDDPDFVAGRLEHALHGALRSPRPRPADARRVGLARSDAAAVPPLYAIVDADVCARAGRSRSTSPRAFLAAASRCLQLRAKHAGPARACSTSPTRWSSRARAAGAIVIVNDRADIARLAGAAGVHVGQDDLPAADARARRRAGRGRRALHAHAPSSCARRLGEPVTYVAIGPVFGTGTKGPATSAVGLELVRRAAADAGAARTAARRDRRHHARARARVSSTRARRRWP